MRITAIIFTIVLSFNIQPEINFQEEYYLIPEYKTQFFDCESANKIFFYEDGTYLREEDLGHRRTDDKGKCEVILIKIEELFGTWTRKGDELILNDKELRKYSCMNTDGHVLDSNLDRSELVFGKSEYLVNASIYKIEDQELYYLNEREVDK